MKSFAGKVELGDGPLRRLVVVVVDALLEPTRKGSLLILTVCNIKGSAVERSWKFVLCYSLDRKVEDSKRGRICVDLCRLDVYLEGYLSCDVVSERLQLAALYVYLRNDASICVHELSNLGKKCFS